MSLAFMMWKGQEGVCGERSGVSMVRRRKGVKQESGSAIGRPEREASMLQVCGWEGFSK